MDQRRPLIDDTETRVQVIELRRPEREWNYFATENRFDEVVCSRFASESGACENAVAAEVPDGIAAAFEPHRSGKFVTYVSEISQHFDRWWDFPFARCMRHT